MPRGIPNNHTKVPNVAPTNPFEAMEQQVGQDHERKMSSTGPAKDALEPAYIEVTDRPVDDEKLAMLAFMEDPVEIHIHTTANPQDEQIFSVSVNNQIEFFRRNETKVVKRKFVENLATRKITTYTQERRRGDDGVMYDAQIPHTALRYPFSVVRDDHPRGRDWLKAVLAQA